MRGFGSRSRRSPGARPLKGNRAVSVTRSPGAELGRATRALVGPERGGRGAGSRAAGRRVPRIGRIVTPARAAGLLGMLASGFLFAFATGPTAFALAAPEVSPLTWTDPDVVRQTIAMPDGGNAFRLDTAPLEAALATLPAVAAADISVTLPDAAVVVTIQERRPVLAWQASDRRFIADAEGVIFAVVDRSFTLPAGVVVVDDRRAGAITPLAIGARLDSVDLDVATRLGSLAPADVGSTAKALRVVATDEDGFVVSTAGGWVAVFGFYSPATRSTDMIPGQVRLLRSLLAGREGEVRRVVLASATDGTYVPRTTPKP